MFGWGILAAPLSYSGVLPGPHWELRDAFDGMVFWRNVGLADGSEWGEQGE
jgi:hypothetical protein